MTHAEIATHLGLKLSQVEWALALLKIINDLSNISNQEKRSVLEGVCGTPPTEDWDLEWDKDWESWSNINVGDSVQRWLITGLNENSTSKISTVLNEIQADQILRDESAILQVSDNDIPPPLLIDQPQADLIVQIYSNEHRRWTYHTINKTWYLSNIDEEPALLDSIVHTLRSSRPIALLRIQQHKHSNICENNKKINFGPLSIYQSSHSKLILGAIEHRQNIIFPKI